MKIDAHIHLVDTTRPQGVPWPSPDKPVLYRPHLPADFRAVTEGLDVTSAIVVEASIWPEDNDWILSLIKDDPIFVGFSGRLDVGSADFSSPTSRDWLKTACFAAFEFTVRCLSESANPRCQPWPSRCGIWASRSTFWWSPMCCPQ